MDQSSISPLPDVRVIGNTNSFNVINKIELADAKPQILTWLSPLEPRQRHQDIRTRRLEGVGKWVLQTNEFQRWVNSKDGSVNQSLFGYGDPGVGKTYLSSLVIDYLCDEVAGESDIVLCFYCEFLGKKEQSTANILGSLLKQIISRVADIPEDINEAFQKASQQIGGRGVLLPDVIKMLQKALAAFKRPFICIDALDESPPSNRRELLESLRQIIQTCPGTRLFLTGRSHIRDEVKQYLSTNVATICIKPTQEDIVRYLLARLEKDTQTDAMSESLKADILRLIPQTLSEIFLLVSLNVDGILAQSTVHRRRERLNQITNGPGLSGTYSATLERIMEQDGDKPKLGIETLMWISCSGRHLKAEELCHALAVEIGSTDIVTDNIPSIRTLLSCTLGLVTLDEGTSTVRLIHSTLQEYLCNHPSLFEKAHSRIAETCLAYLSFQCIKDIPLSCSSVPSTTPFLGYAFAHWGFHCRKEMTDGVKARALKLLGDYEHHISAKLLLTYMASFSENMGLEEPPNGFTGLHGAALLGLEELVVDLIAMKGLDVNERDITGTTPILWAVRCGRLGVIKLLLDLKEVNLEVKDAFGRDPVLWAAVMGHENMLKLLLERPDVDPDIVDNGGRTPLALAAMMGHEGIAKLLLERPDVNPDTTDNDGWGPLSYAAAVGNEGVVKLFLERPDVNPNNADNHGRTPLSHAAALGREGVVQLFLEHGGIILNAADNDGRTPLAYAAALGREGVVQLFLEHEDVILNTADNFGRTPLLCATLMEREGVVRLLLERPDVNPDTTDNDGCRPLSYAAAAGHEGVVKLFLERPDVNLNTADVDGRTPLVHAAVAGHEGVVQLFLEHGGIILNAAGNDG